MKALPARVHSGPTGLEEVTQRTTITQRPPLQVIPASVLQQSLVA